VGGLWLASSALRTHFAVHGCGPGLHGGWQVDRGIASPPPNKKPASPAGAQLDPGADVFANRTNALRYKHETRSIWGA
jgi:hypothetical protein